jgi:uncharacterized Zn-finger protein
MYMHLFHSHCVEQIVAHDELRKYSMQCPENRNQSDQTTLRQAICINKDTNVQSQLLGKKCRAYYKCKALPAKPHMCRECHRRFMRKGWLNRHIKASHRDQLTNL